MSVGSHDDENIEFCRQHNITYEAWHVVKGCDRTHPTVVAAAANHNATTFQVCMRYIVDRGCVPGLGGNHAGSRRRSGSGSRRLCLTVATSADGSRRRRGRDVDIP